ncbi:MAG: TIR domain-containing protein [Tidjanibacter sp.]|nr:TIR domain-containing protein [Tidjanibacter sp.]
MKNDVFISYSRVDFDEVNEFVEMLKQQIPSLSVWFDITGIESGDEFEEKIITAIDQSSYVLFALSDNSINSQWAKDEVMYAKNTDKKVIPILLRGATLKGWFLFKFGRVDCIDSTIPLQVDKLIRNLSNWTNKPTSNEPQEQEVFQPTQPVQHAQPEPVQPAQPEPAQPTEPEPVQPAQPVVSAQPKPASHPTSQPTPKTYKVGDYYDDGTKQGVVFDVWDGGRHGKIVSLDQNKSKWCTNEQIVVGADSKSKGKANTDKVMARGDAEQYPAFTWCRNKGVDWYLPAIDELKLLLLNDSVLDAVNITLAQKGGTKLSNKKLGEWYWSSTERDESGAWFVDMFDGYTKLISKGFPNYVRAVSAF